MGYATKEQLQELMQHISDNIKIPTIGVGGGYAPIGTIIAYMGITAPQDYLICDGATYNIADYRQLADFIATQFGRINYFGGNGTTTFAVPDLRGEFLRGTGTNSHATQGSGANVGEHQDATMHINGYIDTNGSLSIYPPSDSSPISVGNADNYGLKESVSSAFLKDTAYERYTLPTPAKTTYRSRPTNTSVLYCIKAVAAGDVYSTDERVVGTWIDGKPIYQKVFVFNPLVTIPQNTWVDFVDVTSLGIQKIIHSTILGITGCSFPSIVEIANNKLCGYTYDGPYGSIQNLVVQYTKTTD